jgi:hypothetical protein
MDLAVYFRRLPLVAAMELEQAAAPAAVAAMDLGATARLAERSGGDEPWRQALGSFDGEELGDKLRVAGAGSLGDFEESRVGARCRDEKGEEKGRHVSTSSAVVPRGIAR